MITISPNLNNVHSDIRGPLYQEALEMEKKGIKVLKLNTGNPARFGFNMPDSLRNVLIDNIDEAVAYSDVKGMIEARKAILKYALNKGFKDINEDDIFLTNGVSEASSIVSSALLSIGDEILLPTPCYSLWSNNAYLVGAKPVFYRCDSNNEWNPDIKDIISKITNKTKAILVINPNNPTGALYSKDILLQIGEIAKKYKLLLLADEIYDRLVIDDDKHYSLAALFPDLPCISFNGLSKSHMVCGFRCGWLVLSGAKEELKEIREAIMKLTAMRLCSNTLTQLVIPAALDDDLSTKELLVKGGRLFEQREICINELNKINGVNVVKNKAAFYIFPKIDKEKFDFKDDFDFCMKFLHEKHILVIPGGGFEWYEDLRFRIVMLPNTIELEKAIKELSSFLDNHRI